MNGVIFFFSFLCLVQSSLIERFDDWSKRFAIKFRDDHHYENTFLTWVSNNKYIEEVNAKNLSYLLGHNQFSGMNSDEFQTYLGLSGELKVSYEPRQYEVSVDSLELPPSVDWTKTGAVTPVKNQGQCGSCWSFSTTGALEGAYFNKYGTLLSFSEQQLVDCDTLRNGGKDHGCKGGLMDNAFSWISKNGGLCVETEYPYVSGTTTTGGTCQTSCSALSNSKVVDFVDVTPSSDDTMMSALSKRPISIAIEADQKDFQLYKSGVFTGTCGTKLDHGVLLVGYGNEFSDDFYLVKNSWGTSWGDKGYIKLGRGKQYNNGDGQCGLLLQASYPTL
jgi:C1A family cysteine protease